MEYKVENKIILVTGGLSGLGLAMVKSFLENGAKKLIIIDKNEKEGDEVLAALNSKYGENKAVFYKCDVTLDLEDTFKIIIDKFEYVDVIINNAGILNEKSVRKTIEVNVIALMEWTTKFYDYMRKDRQGRGGTIINVSSIYGFKIIPFIPYYNSSKHAVIGFSKSMGHEYNFKKSGVRVVALCPGWTHTNLTSNPKCRDDEDLEDFTKFSQNSEWQNVDSIEKGIIEVFEKADSGTVWVIEESKSAFMI